MPSVLILGAGINGAALARELVLNGVSVCVVDTADLAAGATAYSSRLIHGGLRYLEYGEFDLVRESLAERGRLLRLAPHLVHPLRLVIPVANRFGGLTQSLARFFRLKAKSGVAASRGLWLVRMGLWLYDRYANDRQLPKHSAARLADSCVPGLNNERYHWVCAYSDAQIRYPERMVVALLEDARQLASEENVPFQIFPYHEARLEGKSIEIHRFAMDQQTNEPVERFDPAVIVNATGAWVDHTLARLRVPSKQLMGGMKGSHLVTSNPRLRQKLDQGGLYAEAADGRPVFVLPFGPATLIGTTDVPFSGDPADAAASSTEIDYLLQTVNSLFRDLHLSKDDIDLHYSGVRPLPYEGDATPAAVTRRHWMEEHRDSPVPMYSIIGGKLTTCRSLAETSAVTILARLGMPHLQDSRQRPIPGGENYPASESAVDEQLQRLAAQWDWTLPQVRAVWELCGMRTAAILEELADRNPENLPSGHLPCSFVRWVIRHEWVTRLSDLVERRLMFLYDPNLSLACLRRLAEMLAEEGCMTSGDIEREVGAEIERLRTHFGKRVV